MVKYCCITDCASGRIKDEKVSIFRVPTDPDIYMQWKEALENSGNRLTPKSYVCEKHFREEDVKKEKVLKDDTGSIYYRVSKKKLKF